MVRQRLHTVTGYTGTEPSTVESAVQLNADDIALFEDYLHKLEAVYGQTNAGFRACEVEENPVMSYSIGPERKRDGDMEFFENLDVLFIPFNLEQTCSSMWKSMVRVHQQKDRQHYSGVIDPDNTIAVKFRLRCPSEKNEPVNLKVRCVMRRYVEDDRMILVWRALSDGEGEFSGLHLMKRVGALYGRMNRVKSVIH
ncbi:hypothetical protein V7S43_004112 [Phytophthora oleae]|uniref:Uncharacterized protein n=1 Tax=Phytophthora oleae TaxID=2107226 RepID=A0ABD3FY77_9STRA